MQTWAIIVDSFRESRDRKMFWVMLAMSVLISLLMACVSFEPGRVSFFFGMSEIETGIFTLGHHIKPQAIGSVVVDFIFDLMMGHVGIIVAIIATAGMFTSMLRHGSIEVLLAKPMSRPKLFFARYLGTLTFIGFHGTVFVGLTFLVMGLRWGVWLPGYLLSIPLIVLLYSYLQCVSVLVSIVTRSTLTAVMLTLIAWVGFGGIQITDDLFTEYPLWQRYQTVYAITHTARWIIPNTADISLTARKWAGTDSVVEMMPVMDDEDRAEVNMARRVEAARLKIPIFYTIGSSLTFEMCVLLLAMWRFSKQDF